MPYIEMFNMQTTYMEHNPSGTIREMRARLQYNFYFTRLDEITPSTFMKAVRDKLQDVTRSNQEDVSGTWYFNIDVERPQILRGDSGKTVTY
jgi:dihydroneopterin aldolase